MFVAATRVLLTALAVCAVCAEVLAQSSEHRLNDFFLETSEHARVCSFIVHEKTIQETGGTAPKVEFVERTLRKIIDWKNRIQRVDSRTEQPGLTPGYFLQAHFLDRGKLQMSATDINRVGNIRSSLQSPIGMRPAAARSNFLWLPVNAQTQLASGTQIKMFTDCIPIFDQMRSDRRQQGYFSHKNGTNGCRITFARDPHWLIEEIEFLNGPKEIQNDSVNHDPPSKEEIQTWTPSGKTVTRWGKVGHWWVPVYVNMSFRTVAAQNGEINPLEGSSELFFTDWRFDEDVDLGLLEKDNFTVESISASVDFDAWNEAIRKKAKELLKKQAKL